MHCINKSHFEVKNLAEKLGDSLDVTAAKIAIWQEDNEEYNRFPTYEELNEEGDLSTMYNNAVEQLESFNTKDAGVFSKDTFSLSELKKEYPLLSINIETSKNSIKANATFKKAVNKAANKLKQLEDNKRTREYESLKRRDDSDRSLLSVQEYNPANGADVFIQQKYFSTGRVQKTSDVLQKIIDTNPLFSTMAKALLPIVKRVNDADIILRPTRAIQTTGKIKEAPGVFFSATNTIEIAQHARQINRRSEGLILHEILHSISYKALVANNEINKDFKATYDKAVSVLGTYNPSTKEGLYGTYNIDEFFVGLFTDPKLIKALENIEAVNTASYKNLFQEIFDMILNILNFKSNDNLYTQAFSIATNIIDADRIESEEQEFRMQAEFERDAFEADMQVNQELYDEMFRQQQEMASLPLEDFPKFKPVGYKHKAHQLILDNLDKIKGWEKQIKDPNILYKKIQELGIPKSQMELFINSDGNTVEDKLLSFLSNYSYTIEINTAETKIDVKDDFAPSDFAEINGKYYLVNNGSDTPDEVSEEIYNKYKNKPTTEPTQYYSNLTVPGGTNYTENEIATPQIIPSIKGHGQFSTDNGIGWFRSDDRGKAENSNVVYDISDKFELDENGEAYQKMEYRETSPILPIDIKTRRILEVQSDLFQKGRDKQLLAGYNIGTTIETDKGKFKILDVFKRAILDNQGKETGIEEVAELENLLTGIKGKVKTSDIILKTGNKSENQFLQLLNKGSNWVTFFVKSIIQDSAKKGYEKVLFPSGNTASKIEGHSTLEEFKKQKEDRIKELERQKENNVDGFIEEVDYGDDGRPEMSKISIKQIDNEITQLKQELERVETEGFAALKPIYNFYENTATNVLKKQGYNPTLITDEYGNTWNEVELDEERDLEDIKFKVRPKNTLNTIEREKFKRSVSPGDKTTFKHWNEDSSVVEEYVDINIGEVFDEDFEGYYNEDNKQKFKYENVISNERPNKYDIEEQAIFKKKLYVGAGVVFYVDNIKIEGNITEVGSSMFSVAVDDEIKTFEYADVDSENYERNISELVYGVKEVLRKQLKAFSKKVSTKEQVERLASVEKAIFQLENYKGIDDLLDFMNTVKKSIAKSNALLNNLEKKDLPVDKKLAMMSYVKDYIKSFDIMKQLASQINKLDGSEKLKGVSNALLTELTLTEENYYDRVIPELADWLWSVFPENLNKELLMTNQKPWTKERLIQELRSPSGDLDFFNTYLVPTSNSNDVITGLFSKILKRALDAGRYAVYQMEQAIKPAFQKVQDRFSDMEEVYKNFYIVKDFKVMENGEEKTKKVRYIIDQYNLQEYYDTIRDFKNQTSELWKKLKDADTKAQKDIIKAEIDKIDNKKLKYQKTYGTLVNASKMKSDMEALRDRDSPKFNYDTFGNYLSYFYKITAIPTQNSLEVIDEETGEVTYYEYKENRWNPDKSKFETDEYKKLASGDEDIFNLYKEYKKVYDDLEKMLPESRKMKGLIPCHYEDKAVVNVGKWWKNLTTTTDKQYLSTLGGEVYRQIPIGYSRALDVNESSNDIMSSLMKYSLEVHHFKAKNDILGGVDGITAVLEKYKPFDPTQQSKTKSELNNRRDGIKKFIKQVFYSETRASDAWYDKAIDFFAKGTSVMRMAIKPSNAIANIIMGNYANFAEAYGGRNFTTKDLLKAEKDYFHLIATNPQKLANMLNTLDAVQGRYNLEVGQAFRSTKSKFTIDNIFILQDLGEHQIQGVAMLALLEAKKVPIPEDGNFDLSTLPDNFIDTLHELNKANHGVYNQFDRLYMQDQAIFRLFLQFRKWIVPTFRSKFSGLTEDWRNPQGTNKYRIDIESGTVESGYYRAFAGFIWNYMKDLKQIPNILQDAKNLDPITKEGVKRTLRDGASLLAITALFLPLAGADDDDWVNEEHGDIANWIHWEIIYQLERLRADLALYIPFIGFKDEMRIVNQPFAAASTAVQMYELASMMFDIEEREDGTYGWAQYKRDYGRYKKGDLKMWSRASKLNPLDNPLEDFSPEIQYNNFKASSNA